MSRTDRASLLIHADRETVFAALTAEEALLAWLPPRGMHGRFERFDLRDGGSYRLVLTYDDASGSPGKTAADSDVSEVRIARVVPGQLVEQLVDFESHDPGFQGTMRMTWSLRSTEDGTVVEFEARDVPEGIRARDHAEGLTSSLANLAAYLEPGQGGDERPTYPEGYAAAHGSFALIPAAYVFLVDGDRVLLQMRAGRLHQSINIDNLDPEVDLDVCRDGPIDHEVRVLLKNSFGFGGINAVSLFRRYES